MPEMKECPYCAEQILAVAAKCKHCGEYLDDELREQNRSRESAGTFVRLVAPVEVSISALFAGYLAFGAFIPLLGLIPGLIALFLGRAALKEIERKPNLSGKGRAWFGIIMGVVSIIMALGVGVMILIESMSKR